MINKNRIQELESDDLMYYVAWILHEYPSDMHEGVIDKMSENGYEELKSEARTRKKEGRLWGHI